MSPQHAGRKGWRQGPLEHIAFWQFMAFLMLISLIWVDAAVDLPSLFYRLPQSRFSWYRASLLTAGVILVAFITIAHAYVQQKRALKGLIKVCSYCHRVQVDEQAWHQMEEYVADRTLAEFSHGVCPACFKRVMEDLSTPPPSEPSPSSSRVDSTLDPGGGNP
ncbi:MAG: hypothetical protein KJ726_10665 [Verrucomicrobia bacterium]|nr:hypothetical protein [Verrucomicrobiota bacterium]MBU1910498.1 hypothetical protein [Verrucomicrobiota bacterium]